MARRTAATISEQENLRRELLQILDVHHPEGLREFAKEAYAIGDWKAQSNGDEFGAAFSSLCHLLGGGGITAKKNLAFRTVLESWLENGRAIPQPAANGRVAQVVVGLPDLATVAEAVATHSDLGIAESIRIAQSILERMKEVV